MVRVDEQAPDFELLDQDRTPVSLAEFEGERVVLFFYPEAETSGCTTQACELRDRQTEISASGAVTLGISPDEPELLSQFATRQRLPFKLLSDPGGEVAQRYGVWRRRRRPPFRGENRRTTFLIGPDLRVFQILPDVDPQAHGGLVVAALGATPD
jgi:thioredoxin-dependent peroxiredoxin